MPPLHLEKASNHLGARESSGGAATLSNCGKLYAFDLTVTFLASPPPEGAGKGKRVPASLGGGE